MYNSPGFGIWMGNFRDLYVNEAANATISESIANKIRSRVKNQETAEKLIPVNHGFGTRRVPMETGYYEVYNQANVQLVDLGIHRLPKSHRTALKLLQKPLSST